MVRADASHEIGHGHVVRCLSLADALRSAGARVSFVCRAHEGNLSDLVEQRGLAVHRIPASRAGWQVTEDANAHAAWLRASWREDAEHTRAAIAALGVEPDWLLVDHYAIDHRWERTMRGTVGRIMVIDDLADRVHDCDLLVDQNVVARMRTRYDGKLPATCVLLLGADYVILQPIYAAMRERLHLRRGPIKRIFVYFGGADSDNLTGRSLSAIMALRRSEIEADIVVSRTSPHFDLVRRQVARQTNLRLHADLPTLAPLMADADLAIGAAGATSWERLCLGLPSVVITLAANQVPVARELSRLGFIQYLGHKDQVTETDIEVALRLLTNQDIDSAWSPRCMRLCDGEGTGRIIRSMAACSDSITARQKYQ